MSDDKMKFGLDDLEITDDLDISMDNDTWQDQANPAPPAAGNYTVVARSLDYSKYRNGERQGQPILEDGKYPIFTMGIVEIVEGLGEGVTRKVGVFKDIKTKPFDRFGSPVNALGDVTRAYGTPNWNGLDEGRRLLKEQFEQQTPILVALDWAVYDKDFVDAAFEQLGIDRTMKNAERDEDERKLVNAVYKEARITGMRNFPYDPERGRFSHVLQLKNRSFKHPVTGAIVTVTVPHRALEAKPVITRFYTRKDMESGRYTIGPSKVRPAAETVS